jgi:hypothetical protein
MKENNTSSTSAVNPGVGVDVGTANIVVCRQKADGGFSIRHHRNMLYEIDVNDDSAGFLENSGYLYLKADGKYYIVGEDALKVANTVGKGEIMRPMSGGMLNPNLKRAQDLLFYIIKTVVGEPVTKDECLRFSMPANPVDKPDANNMFHQMVLESFFSKMGYKAKPINEALANLYIEAPSMKVGEEEYPLTGVSASFGGGMMNACFAMRGMSLIEFSNTKCGDNIDQQASTVTGEPVGRIIRLKETKLDLSKVDMDDRVSFALSTYYNEMISRTVKSIAKELAKERREIEGEIEIVVCGGTAMAPGFIDRMSDIVSKQDLPFKVKKVRMSAEPFFSVSQGSCLAAQSDQKKVRGV